MKKVNFNTIDNISTPEDWLKKALAVPETQASTKVPYRQWAVTAAACFVTAAAVVSVMLLLFRFTGPPTEIKLIMVDHTSEPTDLAPQTESTVDALIRPFEMSAPTSDISLPAAFDRQPAAATSDHRSPAEPVVSPIQSSATSPPIPTEQAQTQHPSYLPPTAGSMEEPSAPAADQTESVTTPATESVTEQAYIHTELPSQSATEPAEEYVDTITRGFYIPENDTVYCKITDLTGETLYGDADLYSEQHLCTFIERTKYQTFCSYSPKELGILPEKGCYLCVFYDSYGAVLSTEKVYLNN